ncbi:MAG: hypothetical protein ACI8TQ_002861 [Planctomycetota bacterium]|jgi:hypothetical protein
MSNLSSRLVVRIASLALIAAPIMADVVVVGAGSSFASI